MDFENLRESSSYEKLRDTSHPIAEHLDRLYKIKHIPKNNVTLKTQDMSQYKIKQLLKL